MPTQMPLEDSARVLTLIGGVYDHILRLSERDNVPESQRATVASAVMPVFLDGVRDRLTDDELADKCARAYMAAMKTAIQAGA